MDPENFKWPPVISGPGGAVLEPGGRGVTPRGCRQGGRRGFFLNPTRPVQGGAGSRRDPGAPVEGRWPAAQAGQGSDRGPLPGLQGQHSVGWEQSLPRPSVQPPEKGASVPGLLETGGKERREKPAARQQVPCQTLPGCRRPHTRPGRPQKVVSLPPPFKSGARSLPRRRGVTGRVGQPQISPRSAPVPVPPGRPATTTQALGPGGTAVPPPSLPGGARGTGERGSAASAKPRGVLSCWEHAAPAGDKHSTYREDVSLSLRVRNIGTNN